MWFQDQIFILYLSIGQATVQEVMLLVFLGHSPKVGLCNPLDLRI